MVFNTAGKQVTMFLSISFFQWNFIVPGLQRDRPKGWALMPFPSLRSRLHSPEQIQRGVKEVLGQLVAGRNQLDKRIRSTIKSSLQSSNHKCVGTVTSRLPTDLLILLGPNQYLDQSGSETPDEGGALPPSDIPAFLYRSPPVQTQRSRPADRTLCPKP